MPNRVTEIEIDEVSFVKKSANQRSHVVLWKSDEEPAPKARELDLLARQLREHEEGWELTLAESIAKVLDEYPELYDPQDGVADELVAKRYGLLAKADPWDAARRDAFVDVERLADQLQVAHRSLTRAEAVAKALQMRPEVYDNAVLMSAEGPIQQETAG
jgi:hypothetical protein